MSEQQPSALEVIRQQVTALADPAATFAQIETGLGDLWNAAEQRGDQQSIQFLQVVWENTVALANSNTAANNVAAAALQTAVEMAGQTTAALERVDALTQEVSEVYDEAYSEAYDGVMEQIVNGYNGEAYFGDPGDEVLSILKYEIQRAQPDGSVVRLPCTDSQADDFIRYLAGHTPPMGAAIATRVAAMIAEFGALYDAEVERQTREAQARREALMADLNSKAKAS